MYSEESPPARRASSVVVRRRSKLQEQSREIAFIGQQIRAARLKLGYSQPEFVARLKLHGLERDDSWMSNIENGKNGIDPWSLLLVSRISGYPIEWFIVPGFQPAARTAPRTRLDWDSLYPDDEERSRLHYEVDQHFIRTEERHPELAEQTA